MLALRLLFTVVCLFLYTDSAFALPFALNDIDWNIRYTDYPKSFIGGLVFKDTIIFSDSASGALDIFAGHKIEKIKYVFSTSTTKLRQISFSVTCDSSVNRFTVEENDDYAPYRRMYVEYPLSAANTIINDFCDYFTKGLGPYEKHVADLKEKSKPIYEESIQCYISPIKTVLYEWHDFNTYVSVLVDTMVWDFVKWKRTTKQNIIVKITTYPPTSLYQ